MSPTLRRRLGFTATLREDQTGDAFTLVRPGMNDAALPVRDGRGTVSNRARRGPVGNSLAFQYPDETKTLIWLTILFAVVTLWYDDVRRISSIADGFVGPHGSIRSTTSTTRSSGSRCRPRRVRLGRTYSNAYDPSIPTARQLVHVTDSDGRIYLEVEYGTPEGFVEQARVVRQRDDQESGCSRTRIPRRGQFAGHQHRHALGGDGSPMGRARRALAQ